MFRFGNNEAEKANAMGTGKLTLYESCRGWSLAR